VPFAPLNTAWFALIGLLWAGYLFLEGFDFGVGVVTPFVISDETDRRMCLNAVGPTWDGNEVWLLVAGGATFAAFPLWYARLFNGFYLALFVVLVALIIRGVSFEFRERDARAGWRRGWDVANFVGSLVPAIIWGVAFTDLVHGLPLGPGGRYAGGLPGLLHPVAILGGLTSLAIFVLHGSVFLALKTSGDLADRARRAGRGAGVVAVLLLGGTVGWLGAMGRPSTAGVLPSVVPLVLGLAAIAALVAAVVALAARREGWAFVAGGGAILLVMGAVFASMFPAVIPASNGASAALTIGAASSRHYTLVVMTVVAACFTPFVLLYQGWTYWVFRQRLRRPATSTPDATGSSGGSAPSPAPLG
jgi:cytochrome bd ubiquinol oxidase subunit II